MKKIKLVHFQLLPLLSGVQNVMLMLLDGLEKEKYEIYVISKGGGPLVSKVIDKGWHHIAINYINRKISIKDIYVFFHLFYILKKIKPDILHTHSSKPGFIGRIVGRIVRVPLIIHTIHGFPFHDYQNNFQYFILKKLEIIASKFSNFNIFVNEWERDFAVRELKFAENNSLTIYNGVQTIKKTINNAQSTISTRHLGYIKIVSVLRFCKQKNIVFTIKQAIEVVKKYKNITFTFYGDGELHYKCFELVKNSCTEKNIILKGWYENVIYELPFYDVFLLNSLWEGLPISILEAMSVGLPIICSNIKGNNEIVDETNGWLIDPVSDIDLLTIIEKILVDPSILDDKGIASLKKVTSSFQYELFINEYKKLYEMCNKSLPN